MTAPKEFYLLAIGVAFSIVNPIANAADDHRYANAVPYRQADATKNVPESDAERRLERSLARHQFCQSISLDKEELTIVGLRISQSISVSFIIDKRQSGNDMLSKSEEQILKRWVAMQLALHQDRVATYRNNKYDLLAPRVNQERPTFGCWEVLDHADVEDASRRLNNQEQLGVSNKEKNDTSR
ncbi:hypothetical protein [Stieleria mannarensis]|uniref:hypothetical protein n=1 Tax=Stieleria mannarensis TaxID=2755585 RepID=UPI001604013A|nr:hypothetical protein [Rhodopirellula sp. JC639]